MLWVCVISLVAVLAACASIWGTIDDRRDLGSGNPSLESLMSHTGIWRRDVFVRMLGKPDAKDRFSLPRDKIFKLPISWWKLAFDSTSSDIASIILSVMAPIVWRHNAPLAIAVLAIGAGTQAVGYSIAAVLSLSSGIWRKWLREDEK